MFSLYQEAERVQWDDVRDTRSSQNSFITAAKIRQQAPREGTFVLEIYKK